MNFRDFAVAATLTLGLGALPFAAAEPALAVGCLSGAAAGAVAGHYAGHHAVVGAIGGCVVGHHMKVVERRRAAEQRTQVQTPERTPVATPTP
jgi:hypothetical protein